MNENEQETVDSTNDTEKTENQLEEKTSEQLEIENLKKENDTLKAQKEHWREKAEKKVEISAKEVVKEEIKTTSELSSKDLLALMKAEVNEEDVDEVIDYAKYKGISVAEALKTGVIKTSLAEKVEQRKVADATNTGISKRSSAKLADDVLLSNASKGTMPDNDEDLNRLLDLRKGIRK